MNIVQAESTKPVNVLARAIMKYHYNNIALTLMQYLTRKQ